MEKFSRFIFNFQAYQGPLKDRLDVSFGCSIRQYTGHIGNCITESSTHKSPDVTSSLIMVLFLLLCFITLYTFLEKPCKVYQTKLENNIVPCYFKCVSRFRWSRRLFVNKGWHIG